jgi:hypothetical protein
MLDALHDLRLLGNDAALVSLSVTLGGNVKITVPKTCPREGFAWHADLSYWEGPDTTAAATSPCPRNAKTAAASVTQATPKTQFQCEHVFHTARSRSACFNELPGSSCKHPLEVQKAGPTTRGNARYFNLGFSEETQNLGAPNYGAEQHYSYGPRSNVAICPYPMGAVYKVSLFSETNHCQRTPAGEEVCSHEYDTRNYPEPTTASGGHFHYYMTAVPMKSYYLVVKGYFIHPPWGRGTPLPQGHGVAGQAHARHVGAQPAPLLATTASATNAESTCPQWSGLDTEGHPTGKSPRAIVISRRLLSTGGIRAEPRIVLCKAFIEWTNSEIGEHGHYRLPFQAHGLASFTLAAYTPWTFMVVAEGRYVSGRP